MFATLAAEMADPDRFRRGRAYVRQQAVMDVEVEPGMAHGAVQGSRALPYDVTIGVRTVRRSAAAAAEAGRLNALVPRPDDLTIRCTCPDWGDPCKHGVAVLLALGEELARQPGLLGVWRRADAPTSDEAEPRGTGAGGTGGATVDDDPLAEWLGHGYDPGTTEPLPPLKTRLRAVDGSDVTIELVLGALDDAVATLGRAFGHRPG
jgi:hypothetical protein